MRVASDIQDVGTYQHLGYNALYIIATLPEPDTQRKWLIEPRVNNKKPATLVLTNHNTIISQLEEMQLVLSNNLYKFLDSVLMKYRHLPSRIARRKLEIETFHATDVNIGGGKSNIVAKRTEWLIERFDSDVKLKGLECQQRAVEATIELLDDTMKRVFELRWIDGYTPEEIAELTNSTVKNTQKRLERIMEIFADYWGWT